MMSWKRDDETKHKLKQLKNKKTKTKNKTTTN